MNHESPDRRPPHFTDTSYVSLSEVSLTSSPHITMPVLSHVVSRVRRHFRRRQPRHQQPPELRRWSDFTAPFPPISPGGYKRYYEIYGAPQHDRSSPPVLASISTTTYVHFPSPSHQNSPTSSSSKTRASGTKEVLNAIPEESVGSQSVRTASLSATGSLRRRRRRLLRTPSVERDFPAGMGQPPSPSTDSGMSSGESSSSHITQYDTLDTPSSTVLGCIEDITHLPKEEADVVFDCYSRPTSRNSYHTAKSEFGDD